MVITRKEIISARFPYWSLEITLHGILNFMFCFYTWNSFPLTCRGWTLNNIW